MSETRDDPRRYSNDTRDARLHRRPSSHDQHGTTRKRRSSSVGSDSSSREHAHRSTNSTRSRSPRRNTARSQPRDDSPRSPWLPRRRSRSPYSRRRQRSRSAPRPSPTEEDKSRKAPRSIVARDSHRPRRSRSPETRNDSRRKPRHRRRSPSLSRSPKRPRRTYSDSRSPPPRSRNALPSQDESFRGQAPENQEGTVAPPVQKQQPNFKPTGLLAAETNKITVGSGYNAESVILKYHEPPEARKPPASEPWNLYIFKGASDEPLQTFGLYNRSCWLLGRETAVADIPVDHPSCSKQHAILQFRYITKQDEYGDKKSKVKLYLLDLESANGTRLNGDKVAAARYVECKSGDIIKLGHSEREYVLLLPSKA